MRLDQVGPEQLKSLQQFANLVDQSAGRVRDRLLLGRSGLLALATAQALRDEILVLQNVHYWRDHGQAGYAAKLTRQYEQPLLPAQYLAHCAILAQLAETDEAAANYEQQARAMAVRNGYMMTHT